MYAPHALSGIKIHVGAEIESAMYASFSRGIFILSKIGLKMVPTVKAFILDSTKIAVPVIQAKS